MTKIVTIIGARPQFIKSAPVSNQLRQHNCNEVVVHTGQHFDANMSEVFFSQLKLQNPHYQLNIQSAKHGEMTGRMLIDIEIILLDEKPDIVLVYGDTNSTLAGALAAAKLHIPIAHVEAGLRSFNKKMPEEVNRIMTDHVSNWLFAPTEKAMSHLKNEGISNNNCYQVGDVMYDIYLQFANNRQRQQQVLQQYQLHSQKFVLATIHRASNTDNEDTLSNIVKNLNEVAATVDVLLPLHPRTRSKLQQFGLKFNRVKVVDPIGYLDIIALLEQSQLLITDSGGMQKEAYFTHTPCVTLRQETEWVELVASNWNQLLAPDELQLAQKILASIGQKGANVNLYGAGNAAEKIVSVLQQK